MKYLFPVLLSLPSAGYLLIFLVNVITGKGLSSINMPEFFYLGPVLAFAVSVGLALFTGAKEWIYAALLNGLPLAIFISTLAYMFGHFIFTSD